MSRYKKHHFTTGWPVEDTKSESIMDTDGLIRRLNKYEELLVEADEYLSTNELTSIGSGSVLHQKFRSMTGKY